MRKLLWISGLMAAVAVGCGGQTNAEGTGGAAGSGAGGSGATGGNGATGGSGAVGGSTGGFAGIDGGAGGVGGTPPECYAPSNGPAPYATTIRFVNPGTQPLYVREDCGLNWSLYSCADGYTSELDHVADCMDSCSAPDYGYGCIACGACMMTGHEVTAGQPYETQWSGETYTFGQNQSGCTCYDQHAAPAGKYSITIPVYLSEQDVTYGQPAFEAYGWFDLPAKDGIVEVVLSAPQM